jgi:1-deoxy-D-xylulose-5-phosphate reductoisomerase
MVEYTDGSVIAELGVPDMKGPIAYALSYPERLHDVIAPLDLCKIGKLEFYAPDSEKFRNLELAYRALRKGGTMPAVLNAANEIAVAAFIEGIIKFIDMPEIIEETMNVHSSIEPQTIADVLRVDAWSRMHAKKIVERMKIAQ